MSNKKSFTFHATPVPRGYDPAAEGEAAAKREAEEIQRQHFLKMCDSPKVRVAARKAALALTDLLGHGVRVVDWSISPSGLEVELEDNQSFEKKWISCGKVK